MGLTLRTSTLLKKRKVNQSVEIGRSQISQIVSLKEMTILTKKTLTFRISTESHLYSKILQKKKSGFKKLLIVTSERKVYNLIDSEIIILHR